MSEPAICEPGGSGTIFPLFDFEDDLPTGIRGAIYCFLLVYLFLGVNEVSDKFVSSIEVITSQKKIVRQKQTGRIVTVAVWNGTVANLTLMALGSSAPEILLSVIETFSKKFHSGSLGPSTIVGSAAFNLFMIVAVCISAIPSPETRQIKENGVFLVTAVFSIFAYFWMVVICQVTSPDEIELWEGIITLVFFPVLIGVSYLADVGYFSGGQRPKAPQVGRPLRFEDTSETAHGVGLNSLGMGEEQDVSESDQNASGVLTFPATTWQVSAGFDARLIHVPVIRLQGRQGQVYCSYRTEGRTSVAGYDFVSAEGEIEFFAGQDRAWVSLQLLPKKLGEHSDTFQVILENPRGGATFDPDGDGGLNCSRLTITVLNGNDEISRNSYAMWLFRFFDGIFNADAVKSAIASWREEINDAIFKIGDEDEEDENENGSADGKAPSANDWMMHLISLPWKLLFAVFVPPANLCNGWPCFVACLAWIGGLTVFVIDFAELFGCLTSVPNEITAITLVALGTSMPDLFASRTAAVQDEWADASIVNVTGSNSVNVFLGIGLPWTISAIHWKIVGPTQEWKDAYPDFQDSHPDGAFIVRSGNLSFSVAVFTVGAFIALLLLRLRRLKFGGELGGPRLPQVLSSMLLVFLWVFYLSLSIWKVSAKDAGFGSQAFAVFIGVCILENVVLMCAACAFAFKSPDRRSKRQLVEDLEGCENNSAHSDVNASTIGSRLPPLGTILHSHSLPELRHAGTGDLALYGLKNPCASPSFVNVAMVCLAVSKFKALERHYHSPRETAYGLRREESYDSFSTLFTEPLSASPSALFSPSSSPPESARGGERISVARHVADYVGRNAVDWAALSAAGIAAAQIVSSGDNAPLS